MPTLPLCGILLALHLGADLVAADAPVPETPVANPAAIPAVVLPALRVTPPAPADFLAAVRTDHPRLLLDTAGLKTLQQRVASDATAKGWLAAVRDNAAYFQRQAPISYQPEPVPGQRAQVGPMLWPGRAYVDRIMTLGLLARLEPEGPAFARLRDEVANALTWPDWGNDIARYEIACGMAIAYDWCWARWTAEERLALEDAIAAKALGGFQEDFPRWTGKTQTTAALNRNNVNLVNNAGAALAALALAHERPELAGPVLTRSFALIQVSLAAYSQDGAWYEGMNYWRFATRHLAQYAAALMSATGTDRGLLSGGAFPGIAATATWTLQSCAPSGRPFDFADGDARLFASASLLWLGWQYGIPAAIDYERHITLASAQDKVHKNLAREVVQRLLYDRPGLPKATTLPPLDATFADGDVAVMRSAWNDPLAVFVGMKAGSADGNRHAHLDGGTVVAESLGRRWLAEIGPGPYEKRYFGDDRFRFFQARTEGHGTLVIDPHGPRGGNHDEHGRAIASIVHTQANEGQCRVDLTGLYPGAKVVERVLTLNRSARILHLHDRVELPEARDVRWQIYTPAPVVEAAADGRSVTLAYGADDSGPAARARLELHSADARQRLVIEAAQPLDDNAVLNPGIVNDVRRIAIIVPATAAVTFDVQLVPGG